MNNNATIYTEFKVYFNRINTRKIIEYLLVLHILLIRLLHLEQQLPLRRRRFLLMKTSFSKNM